MVAHGEFAATINQKKTLKKLAKSLQVSQKRLIFVISINKQTKLLIMEKITFKEINYFEIPVLNYNGKVKYQKYGKIYAANFFVDFYNQRIHIPKQPKYNKALAGLEQALFNHYFN